MKSNICAAVLAASSIAAAPALAEAPAAVAAPTTAPAAAPTAIAVPASVTPASLPAPAAPLTITVPEGTEFPMRIEDGLTSKTAQEGDRFTISLTENVPLPDGTVLRAGYRGVGEVIVAEKNGMMGKSGKLNVRLNYIKVGDQRVRLRASKAAQGDHRTGTQVVTFVFVGVFAGFIKGKNTQIPKGTQVTAFADQDVVLTEPLAPPPPEI